MSKEKRQRKWRIGNHQALAHFFEFASQLIKEKPFTIELTYGKRTLDQNALIWRLNGQVAAQKGDMTANEIHDLCKLEIGVPVLLESGDKEFDAFYQASGFAGLIFEEQIAVIHMIPITRDMNKRVFSEYLDRYLRYWSEQGIYLEMPQDEEYIQWASH